LIRVTPDWAEELSGFLRQHLDNAMFPLSNIRRFGIDGVEPYAMRFWVATDSSRITDAIGLANSGALMPVCPNGDWAAVRAVVRGEAVRVLIGPTPQVRPMMAALGLADAPMTLNDDDPHFALDLRQLRLPDGPGRIVPLAEAPKDILRDWLFQYEVEALNATPDVAAKDAAFSYEHYCKDQSHVVLMEGDVPLAMTGFNARLPEAVQIGGVFTPPALRRRGYARRAVALHLDAARRHGVARASLFAGSQTAARAYIAIGFERIGDWSLCILKKPIVVMQDNVHRD